MTRSSRHLRSVLPRKSDGSIAVEFALIAPLLLLLLVVVIDFGRYFYVQISLNSASHEAARVASVMEVSAAAMTTVARATAHGAAGLAQQGNTDSNLLIAACATTTVCTPTTLPTTKLCNVTVAADMVYVTVSTPFHWITPLFGGTDPVLTAKAVMMCSI